MLDGVEYIKVLKANIGLVQEMAQKNEQKRKNHISITMTKERLTECLMLESLFWYFVHGRPTNYTMSGKASYYYQEDYRCDIQS